MADQTATFAIELEDGISGPAQSGEQALESLRAKIQADTRALQEMQRAMRQLNQGTSVNITAFKSLRDQIEAKKASLAGAQQRFISLGGVFGRSAGQAQAAQAKVGSLLEVVNSLGGEAGQVGGRLGAISRALGKAGVAGAAVIAVAAIAALVAILTLVTAKFLSFALGAADAARSTRLLAEAATGSAAGAKALENAVTNVARKAALSREAIEGIALSLARAGLQGAELEGALSAVAITTATLGEAAAAKLKETILQLKKAGDQKGLTKLLKETDEKLGKIAKQQLLSFSNQIQRAKDNISRLFSDLNLEPLLKALDSVLSLLDESTVTGRALKAIMTTLIQPLIDGASKAAPLIKGFFKGMVIAALIFAIAILKVKNALKEAFDGTALEGIDGMKIAVATGAFVFGVLAGAVMLVIGVFAALGAALAIMAAPFIAIGVAIYDLVSAFMEGIDSIASIDVVGVGLNFVKGIADGIMSGASAVINAVTNIGDQAIGAIKAKLEIGSPSRLLAREVGGPMAEGVAGGAEAKAGEVDKAMESLATVPDVTGAGGGRSARGGVVVHIHVEKGAEDKVTDQSFLNKLGEVLERAIIAGQGTVDVTV